MATKKLDEEQSKIELTKEQYDELLKKAETNNDLLARLEALEKAKETPAVSTAPIIIAQPKTEDEQAEADRLAAQKENIKRENSRMMEKVQVRLRKGATKEEREPLFVSVGDLRYSIQRGIYVEVPRCIAMVIEESEIQDEKAVSYQDEQASVYQAGVEAGRL